MNQNNFDNNSSDRDPFVGCDVYSKQYTPVEGGYLEQNSYAPSEKKESREERGRGKRVWPVLIVTLAIAFTSLTSVFVAAQATSSYYEAKYEALLGNYGERPSNESERLPAGDDNSSEQGGFFFNEEGNTEIEFSQSPAETVDGNIGDTDLTKAEVVALVSASVVEITTSETLYSGAVYQSGAGSGVIVNASGMIITNNHVIEGVTNIAVRLTNGNTYPATLVAADANSDIAILKIEPKEELTVAVRGDSDNLLVGEEILAIGNPLGMLGGTVTDGIISAREREITVEGETMTLLQHNAAISPGNSGGALFKMRGELVGIVNAKYSSNGAEGLGFAIPMNTVFEVYEDLCEFGYVKGRADHGLTLATDRYYIFQGYIYVYSSRYTDELQYGDRIVSIGNSSPSTVDQAYALLGQYGIGETVTIVIVRNNRQMTVELTIHEYEPQK